MSICDLDQETNYEAKVNKNLIDFSKEKELNARRIEGNGCTTIYSHDLEITESCKKLLNSLKGYDFTNDVKKKVYITIRLVFRIPLVQRLNQSVLVEVTNSTDLYSVLQILKANADDKIIGPKMHFSFEVFNVKNI